ncbi:MAG: hypothetical protein QNJ13_06045 [Paracoccaceae bacterium]|nr:hypothetical protein [Paracoccaceae bacterium]
MTNLSRNFSAVAQVQPTKPDKKKYPPPFSLRLTYEERARLEQDAAGRPLGAYIRAQLFGENVSPRKKSGNRPVQDQEALGRVLGALGGSRLSSNLNQLAKAVNTGSLPVTPEIESDLQQACRDVTAMRKELVRALDPKRGGEP